MSDHYHYEYAGAATTTAATTPASATTTTSTTPRSIIGITTTSARPASCGVSWVRSVQPWPSTSETLPRRAAGSASSKEHFPESEA